jgi:hypothetical protein
LKLFSGRWHSRGRTPGIPVWLHQNRWSRPCRDSGL